MTYIFSDIPANLAKFCANKPIHIIVSTVLFASVAYLAIFDQYIENEFSNNLQSVNFYRNSSSNDWQLIQSNTELDRYSNANHIYVTPLKFKGKTDSFPTYPDVIKNDNNNNEGFILTDYILDGSNLPEILTNENGNVFKLRSSNNKIGKYFEYFKFLIERLKSLVLGAEPFDIILVSIGYIAMWFTIIQLFYEMKKFGSNFWLAFGSLLSSCFAFLFALAATTEILHIKVPLISLSEGLPFLVATIGFKHKLAFTAPVTKALNSNSNQDISDIISNVVRSKTAVPLIRDQLIISASFLICSFLVENLPGLRNFCILSSIILAIDLFFTFTFYASILSLKAQIFKVHREIEFREALEEDGISSNIAKDVANVSIDLSKGVFKNNRRVVGFKIFMLLGFLGLHLFALGTSWLYDDSADFKTISITNSPTISDAVSNSFESIPSNGILLTLLPVKIYRQATPFTELEHYIVLIFTKLSTALSDPLISKFLFMIAGISVAINIYLLNVTRFHISSLTRNIEINKKNKNNDDNISLSLASTTTISEDLITKKSKKSKRRSKKKNDKKIEEFSIVDSVNLDGEDNIKHGQIIEENSTENDSSSEISELVSTEQSIIRPLDELVEILKAGNVKECNNSEVLKLVIEGKLPLYALEKQLGDKLRAVVVRRQSIAKFADAPVLLTEKLPYKNYDYDRVFGACCENVIGYIPIPLGVAGPIIIDGKAYHIPVATTEGCLVASTMRGCKAINAGGGVETVLTADGMTRGPCVQFPNLTRAGKAKVWLDSEEGQKKMKIAFNSTSRFARLQHIKTAIAGDSLYIRFKTTTGDAMGMNMISKGVEYSLKCMIEEFGFDDMNVVSLSGNYCIDKKAAAINWIEGRGKSIVASSDIPSDVVEKVLKSNVDALVELNISKNLVGSALAGAIGGFNAHAANLLTAVYIATGQDPAQNVESSNCMTLMKKLPNGDLRISVSMPSIEVGTIGGGTVLDPQGAMLELLGIRGPHPTEPGSNARQLAKVVASAVLASELSLCSALAAGHLVQSHMQHNRKAPTAPAASAPVANSADVERLKEGSKICIRS
jgi:hydroxymethylglutaryl-CoA reductase (NADPH)